MTEPSAWYIGSFVKSNVVKHSFFKGPDYFRTTTTLETCAREQFTAENAARAPNPAKRQHRIAQGAFENYTSTSQNPHFLHGTL